MATVTNIYTAHVSSAVTELRSYAATKAGFRRPADTVAYTAGDVISDSTSVAAVLKFPDVAKKNGAGGALLHVQVLIDDNIATPPNLELYMFDEEPTNHVDNVALGLADADLEFLLLSVDLTGSAAKVVNTALSPAGGLLYNAALVLPHPYVCESTSPDLYGLLVTQTGFTPASTTMVLTHLRIERD